MDCNQCKEHSGLVANIDGLCKFKDKMTDPTGTIERLWSAIDKKISKGLLITVVVVVIGLIGTLFGLVYNSNQQILTEFATMKADIATIKALIK